MLPKAQLQTRRELAPTPPEWRLPKVVVPPCALKTIELTWGRASNPFDPPLLHWDELRPEKNTRTKGMPSAKDGIRQSTTEG